MLQGEDDPFADRDVNLDLPASYGRGERTLDSEVEGVAILVGAPVLARETEDGASRTSGLGKDPVKLLADGLEVGLGHEREVEILGEPIVAEIAPLECGATFECESLTKRHARKRDEVHARQ